MESDISATMLNCFGGNDGSINVTMLNGLAPFTYDWTGGIGNTSNPTNLTAGFYNVTITDANGCTVSTAASVNQPQELTLSILSDDSGCPSGSGSATANIVGGMMPYQYFWSNGETTSTINNLDVGTYTVIVTDNNGCTIEDEVVIGSGAQVLGPVRVGRCAKIGANAVITKDVPEKAVMVGIPARNVGIADSEFKPYGITPDSDTKSD